MKPQYDYFYSFPPGPLRVSGRCRVRIYERKNGAQTVLLTDLTSNTGESVAAAAARIATHLATIRGLNRKTTRWIQHEPLSEDGPHLFDELYFTWDSDNIATDPRWQRIDDQQAEALTGDTLDMLNRRFGDQEFQKEKVSTDEPTETQRAT